MNRKAQLFTLFCFAILWFNPFRIAAQKAATTSGVDHSYKPVIIKLDSAGKKFLRLITWHHFWISHTSNNPGTLDVNNQTVSSTTDIALRRSRILIQAQVSPRFLIVSHFGINNQTFINGGAAGVLGSGSSASGQGGKKPQIFIHDAWTEYAVKPGKLHLGAGLHYWNGVSRLSSQSTLNFMTMDAPIFNWHNIEATDQFARQYGVYAKGQIGKLDYRVFINKPFSFGTARNAISSTTQAVNVLNENFANGGYLAWQFKDKESNVLPFFVGSHLGAKKVFNIGAGWYSHKGATATKILNQIDSIQDHDQLNLGVDVYYDAPLNKAKGTALSIYSVFYMNDFGPNYLRNIGILNTHPNAQSIAVNAETSWAGGGNLQPTLGTGTIWYTQLGYLLPRWNNGTGLMPYVCYTYKNFERIGKSSSQFDFGLNYLISNHNAKVTIQYSTRPVYKTVNNVIERNGSKGQFTLQTHIFI